MSNLAFVASAMKTAGAMLRGHNGDDAFMRELSALFVAACRLTGRSIDAQVAIGKAVVSEQGSSAFLDLRDNAPIEVVAPRGELPSTCEASR